MLKKTGILFFFLIRFVLPAQVEKGLVAKYTFNEGKFVNDLGHNHPKAYNLDLDEDRFGNRNMAVYFYGYAYSFLNLGSSGEIKPEKGSISLWLSASAVISQGYGVESNPIIVAKANGAPDCSEGYAMTILAVRPWRFSACAQDSCVRASNTTAKTNVEFGRWYHLVLAYDDSYLWFYVDGELQNRQIKNFRSHFLGGDSVTVGYYNNVKNLRVFKGWIDDIMIYNRVLSASEVKELYKAPNPNKRSVILKWVCIVCCSLLGILLLAGFINYRVRKSIALKEKLIALETRAIRSRMNPHFVFNSLNTLQRFVLEGDKDKSYNYLISFSRLLRKVLESSENETIPLREEIEILTAYLKIEKQRFGNSFEFSVDSEIEQIEQLHIPFMLVQPFAENAVWHGLLKKKGRRLLTITFRQIDDKRIGCEIDDNGVGRHYKNEEPDQIKKKSLGLDFIAQRLKLLKESTGVDCYFEIIDKVAKDGSSLGTMVKLVIPKY